MLSGPFESSRYSHAPDVPWPLAVLAYLYPPGRSADDRWWVRFYASLAIRRTLWPAS